MSQDPSHFTQLANAGQEVIQGNYAAAAQIFELTKTGRCPQEIGELAEVFGLMTVKVEAREHALEKALAQLQAKHRELEDAAKLRAEFGAILSGTIIILSLYAMTLAFLQHVLRLEFGPGAFSSQLLNLGLCVSLSVMLVAFLRSHRYPASTFGFTLNNWKRAVAESLAACGLVLPALALLKAYLVSSDPAYVGRPIWESGLWEPWPFFVLYIWVTFFQELSYRGFQQTVIERLLTGQRRTQIAILLSAAQFGVVHLHYSFRLGMMSFVGAALFGLLYARHRTIVGITLAHYLLGQIIFGPLQLLH